MRSHHVLILALLLVLVPQIHAQSKVHSFDDAKSGLPVKELMVFKDGHALVHHRGKATPDEKGDVAFSNLPEPLLGTFWPSAHSKGWSIKTSTAGWRDVASQANVSNLGELVAQNAGASVYITEKDGPRYAAKLKAEDPLIAGTVVLVEIEEGLKALQLSRIRDITFRDKAPKTKRKTSKRQKVLSFNLAQDADASDGAEIGLTYVSAGFRWIPNYRINIDGDGRASLEMTATLVNDLRDLTDCRLRLVVGVPNFTFASLKDPMALAKHAQQLAQSAQNFSNGNFIGSNMLSNAIHSQSMGYNPNVENPANPIDDRLSDGRNHEDLFVFTVEKVTLKMGDRMTVPLGSFELPYNNHYVLNVPIQVPGEIGRGQSARTRMERLALLPKVMHQIRLRNTTKMPLTTAPALIFSKGKVIAQSMMRYTPSGGVIALDLTKAIDIHVEKQDYEVSRESDAITFGNRHYHRVNYTGSVTLANHDTKKVTVEVNRYLIGHVETAPKDGKQNTLSPFDDLGFIFDRGNKGAAYWNWPSWWRQVNGIEKLSWTVELDPGKQTSLSYSWHYFWR